MLKKLERNEVERPRVMKQKVRVLNSLTEVISKLPEVRDSINSEMHQVKAKAEKLKK